jgi:uncharacterized membrane protein
MRKLIIFHQPINEKNVRFMKRRLYTYIVLVKVLKAQQIYWNFNSLSLSLSLSLFLSLAGFTFLVTKPFSLFERRISVITMNLLQWNFTTNFNIGISKTSNERERERERRREDKIYVNVFVCTFRAEWQVRLMLI